jgi:hypothetical protein
MALKDGMDARKERKSVCLSVINRREKNAKDGINGWHLDAINEWTSLMDGILMDGILMDVISIDVINGWH